MRTDVLSTLLLVGLWIPATAAWQDGSWRIAETESSVVDEIQSQVGNGTASRRAAEGVIVQVKGIFSPPASDVSLTVREITLSGRSSKDGLNTSWSFELIGIGWATATSCSYTFPETLVKGGMVQSHPEGGEFGLNRENEGDDLIVSIGESTPLCLAFPAPMNPEGDLILRIAGEETVIPLSP